MITYAQSKETNNKQNKKEEENNNKKQRHRNRTKQRQKTKQKTKKLHFRFLNNDVKRLLPRQTLSTGATGEPELGTGRQKGKFLSGGVW